MGKFARLVWIAALAVGLSGPAARAAAETLTVAVAANFLAVAEPIARDFETAAGHEVILVSGSSGKLASQIIAGAPYDVLLSADRDRIDDLIARGKGDPASRLTYAVGRLALWSADRKLIAGDGGAVLRAAAFRHVAMANPAVAPYGRAARETLAALGVAEALAGRVVLGESVAQAFGLVAAGGVDLGFVALAQISGPDWRHKGSRWLVPEALHGPILQDAVAVTGRPHERLARAFLAHLAGERSAAIIVAAGYGRAGVRAP